MPGTEQKAEHGQNDQATGPEVDSARREAIGRIGKFAAYTAPAMLAMLTSEARAQVFSIR
jgi:hypothetical protein